MAVEWRKQTTQSLEVALFSQGLQRQMSEDELLLKNRFEDIMRFLGPDNNRILPPVFSAGRSKFDTALAEVLSRLPQDDFETVVSKVVIVLDNPEFNAFALNVAAPTSPDNIQEKGVDTIVFFRLAFSLSPKSLIALIAHEIAHSIVSGNDFLEDEALVNAKIREWGFGREQDCYEIEKKSFIGPNSQIDFSIPPMKT
jgi:hypothetical protein